jgi:hypothetical protein
MTSVVDVDRQFLGLLPKLMKDDAHVACVGKSGRPVDHSIGVARNAVLGLDDVKLQASV